MPSLAELWKARKSDMEKAFKEGTKADKVSVELPAFKDDFQKNLDKVDKFEKEIEKVRAQLEKLLLGLEQQCANTAKVSVKYASALSKLDKNGFGNVKTLRERIKENPIEALKQIESELTEKANEARTVLTKLN